MSRLWTTTRRGRGNGQEAEARRSAGGEIFVGGIDDGVGQTSGRSHHGHRAVLQAVNLIQAAGLVPRRHQENIRAGFDLVRKEVVIRHFHVEFGGIDPSQLAEQFFVFRFTRAEGHHGQVLGQ